MVVALWVEIALHDILLVVPIVCACPAAWGIGNLHQTAAVEEDSFVTVKFVMNESIVYFAYAKTDRFWLQYLFV